MLRRFVCWLAVSALTLAPAASRIEAAPEAASTKKPAVVLRVASIDHLVGTVRYLAEVTGHEDQAKSMEDMIKNAAGPKGLEGIDTKKPLGAYAYIGQQGIDSEVVILIPYTEEKAILDLLERQGQKAKKEDDGTYSIKVENAPFSVHLRFANKYVYVSNSRERLAKEQLQQPAAILPPAQHGTAELLLRINEIPSELKDLALGGIENQLARAKDQQKNESEAENKLKGVTIDEMAGLLKSVLNNGSDLALTLDLDRDASDLSVSLSLSGKDGSPLATSIASMGQIQSLAAGLIGQSSAASMMAYVRLPQAMREAMLPVLEEQQKKALEKEKDQGKRELAETAWKAIKPTLQAAVLDMGFDLRGPSAANLYTVVAGIKVKDGKEIEQLIRKVKAKLPEDNEDLKLDVAKEGTVAIHQVKPRDLDANAKKMFGEKPIYFAVREDAILMALGDEGLAAVKESLAAAPRTASVFEMDLAFSRLAPLMTDKYDKATIEAAQKTLKDKGADRVRVSIKGGKALELRLGMKAQLLAFFGKLQERQKAGAQEK